MKDPLQTTPTAAEVLGIEPGCTVGALATALLDAQRNRGIDGAVAKAAFDTLRDPVKRWTEQLFLYRDLYFEGVGPNPLEDAGALSIERREVTREAWEGRFRSIYPNLPLTHCLAVLTYWDARTEHDRFDAVVASSADPVALADDPACERLAELWKRAISYWAALFATPEFWRSLEGLDIAQSQEVRRAVMDHITRLFDSRLDAYHHHITKVRGAAGADALETLAGVDTACANALRGAGVADLPTLARARVSTLTTLPGIDRDRAVALRREASARVARNSRLPERFRTLWFVLDTEIHGAEAMARAMVSNARGKLPYGALLLTTINQLRPIRERIRQTVEGSQASPLLMGLLDAMSPCAPAIRLLGRSKPEAARDWLEAQASPLSSSDEARELLATAWFDIGKQHASVGQGEEAVEAWGQALAACPKPGLRNALCERVMEAVYARAAAIQQADPDGAIAILDGAVQMLPSAGRLGPLLGQLLHRRADRKLGELVQSVGGSLLKLTSEHVPVIRRYLQDVRRAAELGHEPAVKFAQQLAEFVDHIDAGSLPAAVPEGMVSPKGGSGHERGLSSLLEALTVAAQAKDWDRCVELLRRILELASPADRADFRTFLRISLFNRGTLRRDAAMEKFAGQQKSCDEQINAMLGSADPRAGCCALCHRERISDPGKGPWFTLPVQQGNRSVDVCGACASKLAQIAAGLSQSSPEVAAMYQQAERDFAEAAELDAKREGGAAEALSAIRDRMNTLGIPLADAAPTTTTLTAAAAAAAAASAAGDDGDDGREGSRKPASSSSGATPSDGASADEGRDAPSGRRVRTDSIIDFPSEI